MATVTPSLTASLPNGYGTTVGTANQLAVPPNPTRGGLILFNNSATQVISVCPASLVLIASGTPPLGPGQNLVPGAIPAPTLGVPGTNAPGSLTLQPGQAEIIDNLNCSGAWNGISNVAGGALTTLEF